MAFTQTGVSLEYISVGCNRFSNAADSSPENLVAFGAGKFVALWQLNDTSNRGVYRTLPGHSAQVTTVKFLHSNGGPGSPLVSSGLVSGDTGGEVILWQHAEGDWNPLSRLKGHTSSISALGVMRAPPTELGTSGSQLVVTGASDGSLLVWEITSNAESAKLVEKIDLKGKYPMDIAVTVLSGSSSILMAVACTDSRVQLWSRQQHGFVHRLTLEGHEDWIRCLAFVTEVSQDSLQAPRVTLASGSQDGYIRLWTISQVERTRKDQGPSSAEDVLNDDLLDAFERSMAEGGGTQLSTKAHVLSVSSESETESRVWNYAVTFDALLVGHEGWITGLHWHPYLESSPSTANQSSGQNRQPLLLLSSSSDNSLIMWSQDPSSSIWVNHQRFGDIAGKGMGFFGGLWASRGGDVLAHGWNGSFHRWSRKDSAPVEDRNEIWEPALAVTGHSQAVKDVVWVPDGEYLMSLSSDQTTRMHGPWQAVKDGSPTSRDTWHELARPQIHGYDLVSGAFLNSYRFVSAADEKVARVFDAPRAFVRVLQASGVAPSPVDISSRPSGASVPALGLSNKELSQEETLAYAEVEASDIKRPPVESELASTTLWPEIEKVFGHGYELFAIAGSRDGAFVATSCKSSTPDHAVVRIHETTTWKEVGLPLAGHALTVTRIAFSPSGRYVLTVSRDRTWRLYDSQGAGDYSPVASEKAHARIIWDCAWSSDDSLFATAARDKTVKIWSGESSWTLAATIKLDESATAVDLLRTGQDNKSLILAIGLETGQIELYRASSDYVHTWKKIFTVGSSLAHVDQIHRICWRPGAHHDGTHYLAACSEDTSLRVFSFDSLS